MYRGRFVHSHRALHCTSCHVTSHSGTIVHTSGMAIPMGCVGRFSVSYDVIRQSFLLDKENWWGVQLSNAGVLMLFKDEVFSSPMLVSSCCLRMRVHTSKERVATWLRGFSLLISDTTNKSSEHYKAASTHSFESWGLSLLTTSSQPLPHYPRQ